MWGRRSGKRRNGFLGRGIPLEYPGPRNLPMKNHLLGSALLGLLAATPHAAAAQGIPELRVPPRVITRLILPDTGAVRRIPRDSLRHLLVPRYTIRRTDLVCPMPVSRPDSLPTVPIPRARLAPNSAVPIPVDRTSCRNPL